MIIYKCICGEELPISENTEKSRKEKKRWKNEHDKQLSGHRWKRIVIKKSKR